METEFEWKKRMHKKVLEKSKHKPSFFNFSERVDDLVCVGQGVLVNALFGMPIQNPPWTREKIESELMALYEVEK